MQIHATSKFVGEAWCCPSFGIKEHSIFPISFFCVFTMLLNAWKYLPAMGKLDHLSIAGRYL